MPDGNSDTVPPDSIPNSEVKRVSGDGSVGLPHVRVAHRQAPNKNKEPSLRLGSLLLAASKDATPKVHPDPYRGTPMVSQSSTVHHLSNAIGHSLLSATSVLHPHVRVAHRQAPN